MSVFLRLLDIVFLLMALVSWIAAGEVRYRYRQRILKAEAMLAQLDRRQKHMERVAKELQHRLDTTFGPVTAALHKLKLHLTNDQSHGR